MCLCFRLWAHWAIECRWKLIRTGYGGSGWGRRWHLEEQWSSDPCASDSRPGGISQETLRKPLRPQHSGYVYVILRADCLCLLQASSISYSYFSVQQVQPESPQTSLTAFPQSSSLRILPAGKTWRYDSSNLSFRLETKNMSCLCSELDSHSPQTKALTVRPPAAWCVLLSQRCGPSWKVKDSRKSRAPTGHVSVWSRRNAHPSHPTPAGSSAPSLKPPRVRAHRRAWGKLSPSTTSPQKVTYMYFTWSYTILHDLF